MEDRGTSAVQVRHLYRGKAACCCCTKKGLGSLLSSRRNAVRGPAEAAEGAGGKDSLSTGKTSQKEAPPPVPEEAQGVPRRIGAGIHQLW